MPFIRRVIQKKERYRRYRIAPDYPINPDRKPALFVCGECFKVEKYFLPDSLDDFKIPYCCHLDMLLAGKDTNWHGKTIDQIFNLKHPPLISKEMRVPIDIDTSKQFIDPDQKLWRDDNT